MKRNLKSILKYFIFILITVILTTILFKLFKQFNQYDENGVQLEVINNIANNQLRSNKALKVDWHDWELINMEKLRTG